jgi:hypothetical protein
MMPRWGAYAVVAAVWTLSFVPALLLLWWLEVIEPTFFDFAKAIVILAVIAVAFEFTQRWVARMFERSRGRAASQGERR